MSNEDLADLIRSHCENCNITWCADCGMSAFKRRLFKLNVLKEEC